MQTVDILFGSDRLDHRIGIKIVRQRQLHENAVNFRIRVELGDKGLKLTLRGFGGQCVLHRLEAALLGHTALGRDIDVGGRVIADNDHGQPRSRAGLGLQRIAGGSHLLHHACRDSLAVNHLRHRKPSLICRLASPVLSPRPARLSEPYETKRNG